MTTLPTQVVRLRGSEQVAPLIWPWSAESDPQLDEFFRARLDFLYAREQRNAHGWMGPLEARSASLSNGLLDQFASANNWKRRSPGTPTDNVLGIRLYELQNATEHEQYLVPIVGSSRIAAVIAHIDRAEMVWRRLPDSITVDQLPFSWHWRSNGMQAYCLRRDPAHVVPVAKRVHPWRQSHTSTRSPAGSPNGDVEE